MSLFDDVDDDVNFSLTQPVPVPVAAALRDFAANTSKAKELKCESLVRRIDGNVVDIAHALSA